MEEKERYYYNKILRDCIMPEGLYEIKDRESNFYLIIENKKDVDTITNLLNRQDKRIKELRKTLDENQKLHDLPKKIVEEIKRKIREKYPFCITLEDFDTILKKYGGENE